MRKKLKNFNEVQGIFIASKNLIIFEWLSNDSVQKILKQHDIDRDFFLQKYSDKVFDYFIEIIEDEVKINNYPMIENSLVYLRDKEISSDDLFEICSHLRHSIINFAYDNELNSKEIISEISSVLDRNFRRILKFYTDAIFQKLIDARLEALNAGKAKEYFLSNMSHEIRTPLNAILGFVNLLKNENVSKKHRKYLDIILNSGENLLSIINDILDFSKLRSGEFTIEPKNFSIHEELSHTMELFVASANDKKITITSFIDPTIPSEIYADPLRINQILSNFLSNAIKFTPKGGIISVEATCEGSMLKVKVKDNGIGMLKEDIANVFTAFAQAQFTQNKKNDGTGLGLSICEKLAEHMHGEVTASSTLGKGSTFCLNIPIEITNTHCQIFEDVQEFRSLKIVLYSKDINNLDKYEAFLKYATVFGMQTEVVDNLDIDFDVGIYIHDEIDKEFKDSILKSNKKYIALMQGLSDEYDKYNHVMPMCFPLYCSKIKAVFSEFLNPELYYNEISKKDKKFNGHILVAEDNEANQELIKIILSKYGLTYDLANNGLEAVELYKLNNYDFILMDEQMPIMSGTEAVRDILEYEKQKGFRHTPVSALTANVIKGVREKGLQNGYDAFLGKPIIVKELEKVFEQYLKLVSSEVLEQKIENKNMVVGIDAKKLQDELMLSEDEIIMLTTLFIKKMQKQIPELENLIKTKEYKKIAFIAHSIKGSSGNFRLEYLQKYASEIESMAKDENSRYNYEETFQKIKAIVQEIKIS